MAERRYYLERSDGTGRRHKFYEVTLQGLDVTLRWGRIGAEGQAHLRHFERAKDAAAFAKCRVAEKCRPPKGYALVRPGTHRPLSVPPPPGDHRQVHLDELLRRGPAAPPPAPAGAADEMRKP